MYLETFLNHTETASTMKMPKKIAQKKHAAETISFLESRADITKKKKNRDDVHA